MLKSHLFAVRLIAILICLFLKVNLSVSYQVNSHLAAVSLLQQAKQIHSVENYFQTMLPYRLFVHYFSFLSEEVAKYRKRQGIVAEKEFSMREEDKPLIFQVFNMAQIMFYLGVMMTVELIKAEIRDYKERRQEKKNPPQPQRIEKSPAVWPSQVKAFSLQVQVSL